jgi:hypothetical protein
MLAAFRIRGTQGNSRRWRGSFSASNDGQIQNFGPRVLTTVALAAEIVHPRMAVGGQPEESDFLSP